MHFPESDHVTKTSDTDNSNNSNFNNKLHLDIVVKSYPQESLFPQ